VGGIIKNIAVLGKPGKKITNLSKKYHKAKKLEA
jgi:hypothetical protein